MWKADRLAQIFPLRFLDAMTLVQHFGKHDYFVTMTCNPYWHEVTSELFPSQTPQARLELASRVCRAKLYDMHGRFINKKHFGEVTPYAHVIEFQKRRLPQ